MGVLNALGRYRTVLESQVALLSEQMLGADFFSGPDFEICLPPVSAEDFRRLFDSGDASTHDDWTDPTQAICNFWFLSGEPDPTGAGFWQVPVQPTVRIVEGHCQHCWFQGGLFAKDVASGWVSLVSTWCPVCGMPAKPGRSLCPANVRRSPRSPNPDRTARDALRFRDPATAGDCRRRGVAVPAKEGDCKERDRDSPTKFLHPPWRPPTPHRAFASAGAAFGNGVPASGRLTNSRERLLRKEKVWNTLRTLVGCHCG